MTIVTTVLWVLTAGAAGLFAARFFLLQKSLRDATEQMERLNQSDGRNEKLICTSPDKGLAAFFAEVNRELSESQSARIEYENKEREFRRQISNISHDLRTPLTSVLGYLELLEDDRKEGEKITPAERAGYLEVIRQRAKTLQGLISQFYDLSRLESGEYKLELLPLDLHHSLCETLALFYHDFEEAGFEMSVDLEETLPTVFGDQTAVGRVFFNLLQNILNHGQGQVSVFQRREGNLVVTRFTNQAEGLTQEDMSQIFERFFTSDEMRTGQNTGLGTTIAKRLLERMGHQITARLESGAEVIAKETSPRALGLDTFICEIRWKTI